MEEMENDRWGEELEDMNLDDIRDLGQWISWRKMRMERRDRVQMKEMLRDWGREVKVPHQPA